MVASKVVMTWSSYAYGSHSQHDQSLSWKQAIRGGEVGGRGAIFKLHYDLLYYIFENLIRSAYDMQLMIINKWGT